MQAVATLARIRLATFNDIPVVLEMMMAMREETFWRDVSFEPNPAAVGVWLMHTLTRDPHYRLIVAEIEGRLVGLCMGQLAANPLVPDVPYIYEIALYLLPEYRGRKIAHDMWQEIISWGRQRGAKAAAYSKPIFHHGHEVERLIWRMLT